MTPPPERTSICWFGDNLRLDDNLSLIRAARDTDRLICLYVMQDWWFTPDRFGYRPVGEREWAFISASLRDLDQQLRRRGNRLIVALGDPVSVFQDYAHSFNVTRIVSPRHPGHYEQHQWARSRSMLPQVEFELTDDQTLFTLDELPFAIEDTPRHFTPFHRAIAALEPAAPRPPPRLFPPPPDGLPLETVPQAQDAELVVTGGESAAQQRISDYIWRDQAVLHYRNTRDALQGHNQSSALSAWLAKGCLSVRRAAWEIRSFEELVERNDSTRHLYFELLWREFFRWYAWKHDRDLFSFAGPSGRRPLTTHYPQRLRSWIEGTTPYPIVNACMNELAETGLLSNRGRQLAASCLVNELETDWRYGAAYFQSQLIDHDVASNWGNWQYIAGVGADPRGGRHFDLDFQTERHDPDGIYRRRWLRLSPPSLPLHSVDAADWPLAP